MRQPGSSRRSQQQQQEYGYLPKSSASGRSSGGSVTPNPDIVINGRDSSGDSVGSGGMKMPHSYDSATTPSRLGAASNPNRAEMPDTGRRKSYDQVSHTCTCTCACTMEPRTCTWGYIFVCSRSKKFLYELKYTRVFYVWACRTVCIHACICTLPILNLIHFMCSKHLHVHVHVQVQVHACNIECMA